MDILGCTWEQWPYPDNDPPWDAITVSIQTVIDGYTRVYAPAPEPDGHAHHNTVGEIAAAASTRVTHYMTYTPAGKSTGQPVPHTAAEMDTKLRAIACYETQAQHPSTAPHFTRDQTEYRL
jgi:LmbE family N-acetylglucosaminyl deacetylase